MSPVIYKFKYSDNCGRRKIELFSDVFKRYFISERVNDASKYSRRRLIIFWKKIVFFIKFTIARFADISTFFKSDNSFLTAKRDIIDYLSSVIVNILGFFAAMRADLCSRSRFVKKVQRIICFKNFLLK